VLRHCTIVLLLIHVAKILRQLCLAIILGGYPPPGYILVPGICIPYMAQVPIIQFTKSFVSPQHGWGACHSHSLSLWALGLPNNKVCLAPVSINVSTFCTLLGDQQFHVRSHGFSTTCTFWMGPTCQSLFNRPCKVNTWVFTFPFVCSSWHLVYFCSVENSFHRANSITEDCQSISAGCTQLQLSQSIWCDGTPLLDLSRSVFC
jgi:hypothetical protein